jgi:hypothetical protein
VKLSIFRGRTQDGTTDQAVGTAIRPPETSAPVSRPIEEIVDAVFSAQSRVLGLPGALREYLGLAD